MPSRRHFLAVTVSATAAGCSNVPGVTADCRLNHAIRKDSTVTDEEAIEAEFLFQNLSERAKEVFLKTFNQDDRYYTFQYDGENAPSEFEYSDQLTFYFIRYENNRFEFRTSTQAGCTIR